MNGEVCFPGVSAPSEIVCVLDDERIGIISSLTSDPDLDEELERLFLELKKFEEIVFCSTDLYELSCNFFWS